MTSDEIVFAAEHHHWDVVEGAATAPSDLASVLTRALPRLDAESRSIVAACAARRGGSEVALLLLKMTGDSDVQVAADAAEALGTMGSLPPLDEVLAAIPLRPEPFVRRELYKIIGRSRDSSRLTKLSAVAATETNESAAHWAQVALVLLGGSEARQQLLARVAATDPDEALNIQEQLLFVDEASLAKGLLPWLSSELTVMRLGSDRGPTQMARMCDVAVWTAHLLKVPSAPGPAFLDRFDVATIALASAAIRALP